MAESGNCKHCSNPNHQELMSHLRSEQINDHDLEMIAMFFKSLADPTRCRIINALAMHERVGVCCLADLVGMTVSSVSHQLSILKLQRLVKSEKEGRNVFYSLSDRHVHDVFVTALEHVKE
mgnify:CR=1 FL=1